MVGWAKIKKAAEYAGVYERTVRSWLKAGLSHSRLPSGTVLIKYTSIDEYLDRFKVDEDKNLDHIVDSLAKHVLGTKKKCKEA